MLTMTTSVPNKRRLKDNNKSLYSKGKSLFPHIGTPAFKKYLGFKEQLWLYNLYLHDPNKYNELVGILPPDHDLSYVDTALSFLSSAPNLAIPSPPEDHSTFYFVRDIWTAHLVHYNPKWYEESFSPIDELNLSHRHLLSLQLFTFPLLRLDRIAARLLFWLKKNLEGRDRADIFFHLLKLRIAKEYLTIETEWTDHEAVEDIWNAAILGLNKYGTIQDLNGDYPILDEDQELIEWLDDSTLALLPMMRASDGSNFLPLVPAELYKNSQFHIKDWGFLHFQS